MAEHVSFDDATRRFWRRHIRVAFYILIAESLVVAAYVHTTPGNHRDVLLAMSLVSAAAGVVSLLVFVDRVAEQPWRESFSFAWTVGSGVAAAIVVCLDGGFGSPLLILIPLPVVFAALAFSPGRVVVCGVANLVELVAASVLGARHPAFTADLFVWFSGGVGLTCLTVSAANNRSRLERIEQMLTDELAELAATDGLTGCLNHRAATARLHEEVARASRHRWPLSVIAVDIDHFKDVNDTHGHTKGDAVLRSVAAALGEDLRSGDALGRMGGDEFLVVLPHTDVDGAIARAKRAVRNAGRRAVLPITMSMGIATLDGSDNAGLLLDEADRALYHAKQTGRDGIAVAEHESLHRMAV